MVNFLSYPSQSDRFSKIIIKDKSKDYGAARFYYFRTIRASSVLITKLHNILILIVMMWNLDSPSICEHLDGRVVLAEVGKKASKLC